MLVRQSAATRAVLGVNGAVRDGGYEGDGRGGNDSGCDRQAICSIDRVDQLYRINRFDRCYALVTMPQ